MSGSEKKGNRNAYDIPSIKRVTRKFLVVVLQNNGKEMYKKVCCACKVVFLLIHHFHVDHNAPCSPKILLNHCFQFLLGIMVIPREIEDNGYAKFWGVKLGALWSM